MAPGLLVALCAALAAAALPPAGAEVPAAGLRFLQAANAGAGGAWDGGAAAAAAAGTPAAATAQQAAVLPAQPPAAPVPAAAAVTDTSNTGVLGYLCSQQADLAMTARSPFAVYFHGVLKGFEHYPHQGVVALFAVLIGLLCAWDGPRVWQALFTLVMVGAATGFARIEAEAWEFDTVSELLLMFQAAFATGVAVQSGFDGFQVLFGTAVGFVGAWGCGLGRGRPTPSCRAAPPSGTASVQCLAPWCSLSGSGLCS